MLLLEELHTVSSVRGMCGTKTRAYKVDVSDQRGTCIVERYAKGGLCLCQPLVVLYMASSFWIFSLRSFSFVCIAH